MDLDVITEADIDWDAELRAELAAAEERAAHDAEMRAYYGQVN